MTLLCSIVDSSRGMLLRGERAPSDAEGKPGFCRRILQAGPQGGGEGEREGAGWGPGGVGEQALEEGGAGAEAGWWKCVECVHVCDGGRAARAGGQSQ